MLPSTLAVMAMALAGPDNATIRGLDVEPPRLSLMGTDNSAQLVVSGRLDGGSVVDLTRTATYSSDDPSVGRGRVRRLCSAARTARPAVRIRSGEHEATVAVAVEDTANTRPVSFSVEVVPIFSRQGCNAGTCHGKSTGQNGFRLSLLGFDPKMDWEALVREGRGRRVFQQRAGVEPAAGQGHGQDPPRGRSQVPGRLARISDDRPMDRTGRELRLGEGAEARAARRWPDRRIIDRSGRQQLRVTASYDDGREP